MRGRCRDWLVEHADGVLTVTIFVALVVLLALSGGCRPDSPPSLSGVGSGLAAAEAYRDIAFRSADNPPVVRAALGDTGQKRSLGEASGALAKAEAAMVEEHEARLRAEAELRQERDQWLGDRGKAYIWWIVGTAAAAWAGLGLLGTVLSAATGGASVWAGIIFKLLPLGNVFVSLARRAEQRGRR